MRTEASAGWYNSGIDRLLGRALLLFFVIGLFGACGGAGQPGDPCESNRDCMVGFCDPRIGMCTLPPLEDMGVKTTTDGGGPGLDGGTGTDDGGGPGTDGGPPGTDATLCGTGGDGGQGGAAGGTPYGVAELSPVLGGSGGGGGGDNSGVLGGTGGAGGGAVQLVSLSRLFVRSSGVIHVGGGGVEKAEPTALRSRQVGVAAAAVVCCWRPRWSSWSRAPSWPPTVAEAGPTGEPETARTDIRRT